MRPFAIYHQFQELFAFLQQQLVSVIVDCVCPETIFLLGGTVQRRRSESVFNETAPTSQYISDCSVLIIIPNHNSKELQNLEDSIELHCSSVVSTTVIAITAARFKEWLQAGQPFSISVLDSAVVVYDISNVMYKDYCSSVSVKAINSNQLFREGIGIAKEYFGGAELFFTRKQFNLAVFMLHQAAERALYTLVDIGVGYCPDTHSIERLLRLASLISYRMPDVFQLRNEHEKQLLRLLNRSYLEAHYNNSCTISQDDVVAITKKVNYILETVVSAGGQIFNPGVSQRK
jgi:uncharacterized protein